MKKRSPIKLQMKILFYVAHVVHGVEIETHGPYLTDEERDAKARELHGDDEDSLHWIDVHAGGRMDSGDYSGGFFDED